MNILILSLQTSEILFTDLFLLAVVIGIGALLGRLCEAIKIPVITGYFVAGIAAGLYLMISANDSAYGDLSVISNIGLAFMVFELGTRLHHKKLFHSLGEVVVIVVFQAIFTIGLVFLLFFLFGAPWEMALLFGVIAMATSPETIMVIVRKFKTRGHLTDAIMPHIGLDDMFGVILFAVAISIARAVNGAEEGFTAIAIAEPLLEIFGSIFVGAAIGAVLALFIRSTKQSNPEYRLTYLTETVVAILMVVALTMHEYQMGDIAFVLSPILTPMFAGLVFTNLVTKELRKENDAALDSFTPPFILAFFALIGIQLVVSVTVSPLPLWILLGMTLAYGIIRVVGKQLGVIVGSKVKHTPKAVVKYLVTCLLPQATVSIGMAQVVLHEEVLPEEWRTTLFVVILIAAFVYQLIGPAISAKALVASHEVSPDQLVYFNGVKEPEEPSETHPTHE